MPMPYALCPMPYALCPAQAYARFARRKPMPWVHLALANISVGAKHDRNQYGIITNNLYPVMLRPLQKPDAPYALCPAQAYALCPVVPHLSEKRYISVNSEV
jgi:hypothetical protein